MDSFAHDRGLGTFFMAEIHSSAVINLPVNFMSSSRFVRKKERQKRLASLRCKCDSQLIISNYLSMSLAGAFGSFRASRMTSRLQRKWTISAS